MFKLLIFVIISQKATAFLFTYGDWPRECRKEKSLSFFGSRERESEFLERRVGKKEEEKEALYRCKS